MEKGQRMRPILYKVFLGGTLQKTKLPDFEETFLFESPMPERVQVAFKKSILKAIRKASALKAFYAGLGHVDPPLFLRSSSARPYGTAFFQRA